MYFFIVLRSDCEVTLFIVMIRSQWSLHIKSAKISDLMFFKILLMLEIFKLLLAPIGTMIYYLDSSFVVMLILSLRLPGLLIVLCISSIFFKEILGKLFLIFKISMILRDEACIYDQLFLLLDFPMGLFCKNFDFFRISLLGLEGIDGRILVVTAILLLFNILAFLFELLLVFFRVNFNAMFWQNILLWLSVFSEFYSAL